MATLYTNNAATARYLVWVGQTLSFAFGLAGVPAQHCRGESAWLQEQVAAIVCSLMGHEFKFTDAPFTLEQVAAINRKVILYAAGVVEGRFAVDYPGKGI